MRDRLIELIEEAHRSWLEYVDECAFNQTALSFTFEQMLADHLLAEGVIVPPCKMGQTVYCVWQYSDFAKEEPPFIKEARVVAWVIDEGVPKVVTEDYGEMTDSWHQLLAVGFTKEEAEKALAERSENGKS